MSIVPNRDQFVALASSPEEGPVVMINLLKFPGGRQSEGAASYQRYADQAVKMVEEQGGTLLWLGRVDQVLIGDEEADAWDSAALVQYPSRQAFIDMVSKPAYQDAHTHREAGLERTVLLACSPRLKADGFG
jgi:uncharacterized protein (DUF1330 family)